MAELNIIHPFREGNGRTIRELNRIIANHCGYDLNWGNADKDSILNAPIESVDNYKVLKNVLKKCTDNFCGTAEF